MPDASILLDICTRIWVGRNAVSIFDYVALHMTKYVEYLWNQDNTRVTPTLYQS
jgi:hypothetical protein